MCRKTLLALFAATMLGSCAGAGQLGTNQHAGSKTSGVVREKHEDTSLSWLVGLWEWRIKERTSSRLPLLESFSRLCVYPYVDYSQFVSPNGMHVAAELLTKDLHGTYGVLDHSRPVIVTSNEIFAGFGDSWVFDYKHTKKDGKHFLELRIQNYRIVLEKVSNDPGTPIDFERLFWSVKGIGADWKEREAEYRKKMNLDRGKETQK